MTTTDASPGTNSTDQLTRFAIYRQMVQMRGLEKRAHDLLLQNLVSLQSRGHVEDVRAECVYRLGYAVRTLAERSHTSPVLRLAAPAMAELRHRRVRQ
jgi:hypothetical protein